MAKSQRLRRAQGGRDGLRSPERVSRPARCPATGSAPDPRTSGARALQAALRARLREPAAGARWSTRRTLAFVVCASLALWGGLIGAVIVLARLIA